MKKSNTIFLFNYPKGGYLFSLKLSISILVITFSTLAVGQTNFYIANRDGNNVLRYTMDGEFIEEFVVANSGGLSSPQEVMFHPTDEILLVTGFNNSNIKKYDGLTGAYLGNFSSGYSLSKPTKMSIGPDSLLYVSQWGSTQNKIVRFDLQGNFVSEWSSVNVPEGCGMIWDEDGNMYVSTWSDGQNNGTAGFVRKFDSEGNDLGIAVSTSTLQGPVGIWIGNNDNLFVIDWTLGRVMEFDTLGNFIGNFITGMTRTEGNAKGPDGKYYLCDWQSNRVNRYNSNGTLDQILVNSGLSVPNGITFGPDNITSLEKLKSTEKKIKAFPNPANDIIHFELGEFNNSPIQIRVFSTDGKLVLNKEIDELNSLSNLPLNLSSLEKGWYHFSVAQDEIIRKGNFVKM